MYPIEVDFKAAGVARYIQLANAIRKAIKRGKLLPGEKLSSARRMSQVYDLNRHTVMSALQLLIAEGWLESRQRAGYFVTHSLPIEASVQSRSLPQFERYHFEFTGGAITSDMNMSMEDYQYNFSGGLPALGQFPFDEFKRAMGTAFQRLEPHLLHYGQVCGVPELKKQITAYLNRARNLQVDQMLVCNGSQEALYIIAKAFTLPGDFIAVETLGYPPARKAFSACGASLIDIQQDSDGLCVRDLAEQLQRYPIKLLYLTPLHQYPTTVTLSMTRRMQIYQLCYEHGVAIIEDDYDHEFHFRCQPIAPLAADDPAGIVIYVSTFSKLMFAGARLGYIVCSAQGMQQLKRIKQLINHKNDVLTQLTVAQWMREGGFERHLKRMTKLYKQKYHHLDQKLRHYQTMGYPINYLRPDGGMAMWVDTGVNISMLKAGAKLRGVYLQTQPEFYFDQSVRSLKPEDKAQTHIRLGFAGQSIEETTAGLKILIELLYHAG